MTAVSRAASQTTRRGSAADRGSVTGPLVGVAVACAVRTWTGSPAPAASVPAALAATALLLGVFAAAPRGLGPVTWRGAGLGVAGGAALVAVSLVGLPAPALGPRAPAATLSGWVALIAVVVLAEELAVRGTLFSAVAARRGEAVAVMVTAAVFAVMHVPLYGAAALPVDLCAGVVLGALRVLSRGVTAPFLAHLVADLAAGWLG